MHKPDGMVSDAETKKAPEPKPGRPVRKYRRYYDRSETEETTTP
jgi:hypothetical protein